jgi:hypothetical protein
MEMQFRVLMNGKGRTKQECWLDAVKIFLHEVQMPEMKQVTNRTLQAQRPVFSVAWRGSDDLEEYPFDQFLAQARRRRRDS